MWLFQTCHVTEYSPAETIKTARVVKNISKIVNTRSSQFSWSYALERLCPRTNIRAYLSWYKFVKGSVSCSSNIFREKSYLREGQERVRGLKKTFKFYEFYLHYQHHLTCVQCSEWLSLWSNKTYLNSLSHLVPFLSRLFLSRLKPTGHTTKGPAVTSVSFWCGQCCACVRQLNRSG